jgi:hypothetical protein
MKNVPVTKDDGTHGPQRPEDDDALYSLVDGLQACSCEQTPSIQRCGIEVTANFTTVRNAESGTLL